MKTFLVLSAWLFLMRIARFEDIEGWQFARALMNGVYDVACAGKFARDYGLRDQITRAAGSVMHNIAEGFDGGSNAEFARFLRIAQRSCTEVKSQLYIALDRKYINQEQFERLYEQASKTHAKIGGFIRYLSTADKPRQRPNSTRNSEPQSTHRTNRS